MLTPIDQLLAIEDIKKLKARYCRYLDSHDWGNLRSLLTEDCVFGAGGREDTKALTHSAGPIPEDAWVTPRIEGAEAIVDWVRKSSTGFTVHLAMLPEIDIVSSVEAKALWAMQGLARLPGRFRHAHGFYRETYAKRNSDWLISSFELLRTSLEFHDFGSAIGVVA